MWVFFFLENEKYVKNEIKIEALITIIIYYFSKIIITDNYHTLMVMICLVNVSRILNRIEPILIMYLDPFYYYTLTILTISIKIEIIKIFNFIIENIFLLFKSFIHNLTLYYTIKLFSLCNPYFLFFVKDDSISECNFNIVSLYKSELDFFFLENWDIYYLVFNFSKNEIIFVPVYVTLLILLYFIFLKKKFNKYFFFKIKLFFNKRFNKFYFYMYIHEDEYYMDNKWIELNKNTDIFKYGINKIDYILNNFLKNKNSNEITLDYVYIYKHAKKYVMQPRIELLLYLGILFMQLSFLSLFI